MEKGGPEFSEAQAKSIAASFEVTDGPNADGEMFSRPARLSDKFPMPFTNEKASQAANGGALTVQRSNVTIEHSCFITNTATNVNLQRKMCMWGCMQQSCG